MGLGANMRRLKKFRTLKELYAVTAQVELPKSTTVLQGNCSFRGPMEETEGSDQMNMGFSSTEGEIGKHFPSGKCNESEESATRNVCTVPCSCCMHFSQVASLVGTKGGITDEAFSVKDASRHTFDDASVLYQSKSSMFNDKHHTCSDTSNLLSSCSSHNSFSENAESKTVPRASDMSEVNEMHIKINSGQAIAGNHNFSNPPIFESNKKQRELELLGDNISCISRADGTDVILGDHNSDANRKNISCSSASVNSFPADIKDINIQSCCLVGSHFDEVEVDHHRRPFGFKGSSQSSADVSKKLEVPENFPGATLPKGEPSECSEEQVESTLTRGAVVGVGGQIHAAHNHSESLEPSAAMENRESSAEAMNISKVQLGNSSVIVEEPKTQEYLLPSQPDIDKNISMDLEVDVKICDICGDEGQRHRLAVCSKCSDGAEHTYCMRMKLDKVPEGYWICEVCTLKQEKEYQNQAKFDKASRLSRKLSLKKMRHNCEGSSASKVIRLLPWDVKHSTVEKGITSKLGSTFHCSAKRPGINLEGTSMTKRRALETTIGSSNLSRPCHATVLQQGSSSRSLDKGKTKITSEKNSPNDHSSKVFKPSKAILLRQNSSSKNLEKGKANSACEITSLNDHTSTKVSENTNFHKLHKIESKPQISKGHLYKSKSFNIVDSKVGVQLPVQGVPDKQKTAKHAASGDSRNAGNPRVMHKSKSFNNASSDHFDFRHTKVKRLSSNVSCSVDVKKLRRSKEWCSSQSEQTSKLYERPANLSVPASGLAPLTSDRKLGSNVASISRDMRTSNCSKDSNGSPNRRSHLAHTSSRYPNKGNELVADVVGQNVEHSTEAAVLAKPTNKTNANFPADGRRQTVLPKIVSDVIPYSVAVPEPNYIWRGGFELQRSEMLASSYDGIQAHLSTYASPKALEVVDRLPLKIVLEEVPRLSTWPTQFLENPATENNIALYFFAKDIESYEKNYRSLLQCMTENDLALRGNLDGIELLIFPSNLLPQESQHWNKLLFLWGVFRVRRSECMPNFQVKAPIPNSEAMPSLGKMSIPNSEHTPTSQEMISDPSLNLVSPENYASNLECLPKFEKKTSTLNSESMLNSPEKMCIPIFDTASPNKEVLNPVVSSGQSGDSVSTSTVSDNAQQTSNAISSLRLAPVSSGSAFPICEPQVTTEQKIFGSQATSTQQPCVDTSSQHELFSGNVLPSKTILRPEIDLNSCCEEEEEEEEEEPKRMEDWSNGMSGSPGGSNYTADEAMFRINGIDPSFPIKDQKRIGACSIGIDPNLASYIYSGNAVESNMEVKTTTDRRVVAAEGKDKPIPNLELSLCDETEESARDAVLPSSPELATNRVMAVFSGTSGNGNANAEQHANIVIQNKSKDKGSDNDQAPYQPLPDRIQGHGGRTYLSLFGQRLII